MWFDPRGKSNAVAPSDPAKAQQQAPTPGRRTLVQQEGYGPDGTAEKSKDNFLNPMQRLRLETEVGLRIVSKQMVHSRAFTELHCENLIQKPEELNAWVALFETVAGKLGEYVVMKAFTVLAKGGVAVEKLAEAKISEVSEKEAEAKILGVSEKNVEALVAGGVDKVKEKAADKATEAQNEAGQEDQAAAGSYIDYLADKMMLYYERLRHQVIARKPSDAELLVIMDAYSVEHYSGSLVKARTKEHIDLFLHSHAKDIGHKVEDKKVQGDHGTIHIDVRRETRVAYVINGRKERQLVYIEKEFKGDYDANGYGSDDDKEIDGDYEHPDKHNGGGLTPGPAYTAPENALGLEDESTWNNHSGYGPKEVRGKMHEVEPEFLGPVELELQAAALAMHRKRWLQEPQTLMKGPYGWVVVK